MQNSIFRKTRIGIYLLFLGVFLFSYCQSDTTTSNNVDGITSKRLDKTTFATQLKNSTNHLLIDVRTPQEYQAGNIQGAINLNYHDDNFEAELEKLDKNQTTYIYCQSGGRSGKTLHKMKTMGFKEVYELKTGYSSW